jgi:C_GCAxxG_C_C family probable redox protein
MDRITQALDTFKQRFNCSQALFVAFRDTERMDEKTALKLSTVFGAGVACTGGTCGAVSGALMAISMKHGRGDLAAVDAKTKTYQLGRQFMDAFKQHNGSCVCEQLLGMNIGVPENMAKAQAAGLFETKCYGLVKSAAEILDGML